MLTEKEKEWLALRELRHFETGYYMSSFKHKGKTWYSFSVYTDWKAAAEFEARVAATIARGEFYRPCHSVDLEKCAYPGEGNCCVCHIKYARLAVEAEMEKEK